jgi:membrane-associated phospholipid phosphatase
MFQFIRIKILRPPVLVLSAMFIVVLGLSVIGPAMARPATKGDTSEMEPKAGSWKTWVLKSGDQFKSAAPPDDAATQKEIAQLKDMVAKRDDAALAQIAYWNSGAPAYRWNQIGSDYMADHVTALAVRDQALLSVAIYDATIAAWDSKYTYNRQRPSEVDSSLTTAIANPNSPSYPSDYAATASAASAVLSWLFPDDAKMFADKAQEAVNSRMLAGVEYQSDVDAGMKIGQQVAELVIAHGKADNSDAKWTGTVPTDPGKWTGENPIFPMGGSWKPWVLKSGDEFRPPPPPAYDSDQEKKDMQELHDFKRTPVTTALAQWWEYGVGGRRQYWFWDMETSQIILSSTWANDAPRAARAYALMNVANYDAFIATFDAKYTYWAIRPSQLDPKYTTILPTPNHPAYPSAHSTLSTAVTDVLAYLSPADAADVTAMALEASESRIWAGIHFRTDVNVGRDMGHKIGGAVIDYAKADGSD